MPDVRVCPKCHHQNRSEARFCSACGNSLAGVPLTASPDTSPSPRPKVEGMRWRMRSGEVAARIESRDMPDQNKQLIVEENTLALLLENGAVVSQHGPGTHTVQSFEDNWFRRRAERTAILLDSGEIPVEFTLADLWTIDPLRLSATCWLVVQIVDAKRFVANVLKGRPTFNVADLRQLLYPEIYDAAQTYVGDHSMEQLEAERNQRREDFAVDVQERLRDFFSQSGLAFKRVQMFDLRHPRIDAMRKKEEELFLGPADFDLDQRRFEQEYARKQAEQRGLDRNRDLELNAKRQEFAHRQRLYDLMTEEELHKIAQEEAKAAQFEQRAQIWDRMRRAVQQDKLNEATTQEEWAKFVAETDKRKLLREDELKQFRDSLRWGDEDRQKERAHTLVLAELFSQYERKAAELSEQHKYDQAKLQNELALQRARILGGLELRQDEVAAQLRLDAAERARQQAATAAEREEAARASAHAQDELEKAQAARRDQERQQQDHILGLDRDRQDHDRTQRTANVATDLDIRQQTSTVDSTIALQQAKTADEIARLQRQRDLDDDKADLEVAGEAMRLLKENRANRLRMEREDEEEKRRIARADELRRQEAAIAAEKERHAMDLAKTAQAQQHELSTLKMRSEMSIEALISLSGPQQAQILGELKRTEHFKGMSEEQIMILAAERSPDVAKALLARMQAAEEGKLQAAEAAKWQALADERSKHEAAQRQQIEAHQAAQMKVVEAAAARETQAAREAAERAERMAKEAADRQERSNSDALHVVGDVAKTFAQNQPAPAAGPTVILPAGGAGTPSAPTVVGGTIGGVSTGAPGASGEVQVCPNCRVKMPVGEKFCANCGHQFFA